MEDLIVPHTHSVENLVRKLANWTICCHIIGCSTVLWPMWFEVLEFVIGSK